MEITLPPKNDLSERIVLQNPHNIVIIGANGAGKTTITNLINRFYDIADGKIRYDGININLTLPILPTPLPDSLKKLSAKNRLLKHKRNSSNCFAYFNMKNSKR